MKLTEDIILLHIMEYIGKCDADELARITGQIFGGKCYYMVEQDVDNDTYGEEYYDFRPGKNYAGEFDNEAKV